MLAELGKVNTAYPNVSGRGGQNRMKRIRILTTNGCHLYALPELPVLGMGVG